MLFRSQPLSVPPIWNIDDFKPGGDIANFAGSDYYYFNGTATDWNDFFNPDLNFNSVSLPDGIYYATGGITFNTSDWNQFDLDNDHDPDLDALYGVTLVSPGIIDVQVPSGACNEDECFTHLPYTVDTDLAKAAGIATVMPLAFSTAGDQTCGNSNDAINIGGKYLWEGAIYAPNGQIAISTSASGSSNGALIGYTVTVSGSDLDIAFDPDSIPPVPPEVGVVQ